MEAGDWNGARAAVTGLAPPRFGALRGYEDEEKKAYATALRDQGKELLAEIAAGLIVCTREEFEEDRAALYPIVEKLPFLLPGFWIARGIRLILRSIQMK